MGFFDDAVKGAGIGAALPLVGGVVAQGAGYLSAQQTNAQNREIADNANAMNRDEAEKDRNFQNAQSVAQMDYQTRMSNSAHQREVEDLKKSVLNPILSVNAGSSTPTGASGSAAQASSTTIPMQNPGSQLSGLMNSALEAMNMAGTINKTRAETELIKAQTGKTGVDTEVAKKGIPESELKNDAYDVIRPMIQKLKRLIMDGPSAKSPYTKYNLAPSIGKTKLP